MKERDWNDVQDLPLFRSLQKFTVWLMKLAEDWPEEETPLATLLFNASSHINVKMIWADSYAGHKEALAYLSECKAFVAETNHFLLEAIKRGLIDPEREKQRLDAYKADLKQLEEYIAFEREAALTGYTKPDDVF